MVAAGPRLVAAGYLNGCIQPVHIRFPGCSDVRNKKTVSSWQGSGDHKLNRVAARTAVDLEEAEVVG